MTSNEMPLMIDNAMDEAAMQVDLDDVDDLFGDGVPLTLPPRPPSKRLHQRLDELRKSGSCQGVAWSKTGTIASIAPGGRGLELRYLRADPETAQWSLSDPTAFTPSETFPGGPIVHLTWSPTNNSSELAIIDAVGRISIFNFGTNLNRPSRARAWDADPLDDLHAVVGTYWLNLMPTHQSKVHPLYSPAVKAGDRYNYEPSFVPVSGPYHPNPARSALITVTSRGVLKMFWYQITGKIEETTLDLESVTSADDLITHASICSDLKRASLFIAMKTQSNQMRIVQVRIQWDAAKSDSQQAQVPMNKPLSPVLHVKHLATSAWLSGTTESHLDSAMPKVSHLEFIPTWPNQATKKMAAPMIVAVRSFVPTLSSPYNQEIQSSIDIWELQADGQQSVHPSFEKLGSRRSSVGNPQQDAMCLKKLDPILLDKVVVGVTQIPLGKGICFAFADGTLEYRDRFTMQPMYHEVNLERIGSLLEVGFTMEEESACLQTALSPTTLSVIQQNETGKLHWHKLRYNHGDGSSQLAGGQLSSAIAALTMTTAQSAYAQINIDDILAIARTFKAQKGFSSQWISEMVRLLKIIVDYSEEVPHDHLFRNNQLQLLFSILNHIGWNGISQDREFSSKLSTIALNLRNIVILITIANNNTPRQGPTPMDEPEVVSALAGCMKWSIDFLSWLTDSLFCLLDDSEFLAILRKSPPNFTELTTYLQTRNDVALHVIMCSSIRGLLNAICRRIGLLDNLSLMALKYYESRVGKDEPSGTPGAPPTGGKAGSYGSPLHLAYKRIQQATSSAMIKTSDFDAVLTSFSTSIRAVYKVSVEQLNKQQAANNPPSGDRKGQEDAGVRARASCELALLLGGPPPPTFQQPLNKLFTQDLPKLREQCDPSKLFFADYGLLEIDDEPKALERKRGKGIYVDMFKRVEIRKGSASSGANAGQGGKGGSEGASNGTAVGPTQWRFCVRCASVMEDFGQANTRPNLAFVLSQQRNCSCGGRMVLLPPQ